MRGYHGRDDQLSDMTAMGVELQSDALLAGCRGLYTEAGLRAKIERHERHVPDRILEEKQNNRIIEIAVTEMTEALVSDLIRLARLDERSAQVVEWRRDGWTYPEIGAALEMSEDAARKAFTRAHCRILRALISHPYYGLMEVYLAEVSRGRKKTD